jgi:TolA-binding protein
MEEILNITKPLVVVIALAFAIPGVARADQVSDIKAQVEALQKQLEDLKAKLEQVTGQVQSQKQVQEQQEKKNEQFIQRAAGSGLTFLVPGGGDVTLYGNLDVSFDYTTKGLASSYDPGGSPVGQMGWEPAISSNLSYLGVRGRHPLQQDLDFVRQLEGPCFRNAGNQNTTSNNSDAVNGALSPQQLHRLAGRLGRHQDRQGGDTA